MQAVDRGPPEQRVAHGLQCLLVLDDALSLMGVPRQLAIDVAGHDRSSGLFQLQKDDVFGAAAFEQRHVAPQTDAADTDHLMGDVDQRIAAQDTPPVRREGAEIVVDAGSNPLPRDRRNASDERWLLDDAPVPIGFGGEPWNSTIARARARQFGGRSGRQSRAAGQGRLCGPLLSRRTKRAWYATRRS